MEHRYIVLRNHLDELGYRETLARDSVPLVERLLADLVKTTESLYHYKNVAQCAVEERDQLRLGAEPFKCDNAKLVKECNDLHLAFLQYREQTDKAQKELKRKITSLEHQNEDLHRHLITQKAGDKTSKTSFRRTIPSRPTLTSKTSVTKPASADSGKYSRSDKSSVKHKCESATMAPDNQQCLMFELKKLKADLVRSQDECDAYKSKLMNREKEIERMSGLLEGGRPLHALNRDCCYQDMQIKLKSLGDENTRLTNIRKGLEKRLEDAIAKQHDAMKKALQLADRNKELERELRDIDQMALAVEEECNTAVKKNYSKVSKVQEQLHNSNCKINCLEEEIQELKRTKSQLEEDNISLKEEKINLQQLLENTVDDKKKLTDRINQFTRIEHDLNLEIDRLMQSNTLQKRKISDLEYQVKMNNNINMLPKEKCVNCSKSKAKIPEVTKDEAAQIEQLKGERDYYQKECQRLCDELSTTKNDQTPEVEIRRSLREKEQQIQRLEKEMQEITRDKHQLLTKLNDIQPGGDNKFSECNTLRSNLSRTEKERDLARNDIRRLESERDSLQRRLKQSTDTYEGECERLKKTLAESEKKLRSMELERRELSTATGCRQNTIQQLEEQIASLSSQLRTTQCELEHIHMLYTQIKNLQEQTDRALADTQHQLSQMEMDYNHTQDRCKDLERQRDEQCKEICSLKADLTTMKSNLTKIDCQRDNLLIEVDNKTERIVALEHDLKQKETKLASVENQLCELRQQLSSYTDETSSKEYQLRSTCQELCNIKREMDELVKTKNSLTAENRRLQNELARVTLDWRSSCNELQSAQKQIDDVKTQLQQYVFEVKRAEDLISKKECERNQMLDQFKCLSEEANMLNTSNHCLENQAMEIKTQLTKAQNQIQDLETTVLSLNTLNKDYERQIAELSCHIACLETKIKSHENGSNKTEIDLAAMKDLCVKLDGQKEKMRKEMQEKEKYFCNVEKEKENLMVEIKKLQENLSREKNSIGSLEHLLAQSRQETVEQQLMNSDMQQEVQRLKNVVQELQSKLTLTSQQLDVFQEKSLDYSQQLKQLRREIANERFRAHSGDLSSRPCSVQTTDTLTRPCENAYSRSPSMKKSTKETISEVIRRATSPPVDDSSYWSQSCNTPKCRTPSSRSPSKSRLTMDSFNRSTISPTTVDFTKATYSYNYTGSMRSLGTNTRPTSSTSRSCPAARCLTGTRNAQVATRNSQSEPRSYNPSRPSSGRRGCNLDGRGCCCTRCTCND